MAYLPPKDDEQQAGIPAAPVLSSAPVASAAPAGGAPQPAQPQAPKADRFNTIRGFLDANREQGQQLAQRVGQTIGGNLQNAQQAQQQGAQNWQNRALVGRQVWEAKNAAAQAKWNAGQESKRQAAYAGSYQAKADPRDWAAIGEKAQRRVDADYYAALDRINAERYQPLARPADPAPFVADTSAAKTGREQIAAFGGDLASDTAALRNVIGGGGQFDAALLGQAAPNLGSDLSNRYGGILAALENPTAPTIPLTEAEKAARKLYR